MLGVTHDLTPGCVLADCFFVEPCEFSSKATAGTNHIAPAVPPSWQPVQVRLKSTAVLCAS